MGPHLSSARTLMPGSLDPSAPSGDWTWDRLILTGSTGAGQSCMGLRKGYLAVHELGDGPDYWFGLSHLPTGARIVEFAMLSTAIACAIELQALSGWDGVGVDRISPHMRAAVVPILKKFWASEQSGGR